MRKFSGLLIEEDVYMGGVVRFSLENIGGMLLAVYHYSPMG